MNAHRNRAPAPVMDQADVQDLEHSQKVAYGLAASLRRMGVPVPVVVVAHWPQHPGWGEIALVGGHFHRRYTEQGVQPIGDRQLDATGTIAELQRYNVPVSTLRQGMDEALSRLLVPIQAEVEAAHIKLVGRRG